MNLPDQEPSREDPTDGLLVFADDWGRHPSSCQHLIRRLREHRRVLWANTIGTRTPSVDGFTLFRGGEKLKSWARGLRRTHENMWVVDVPMLPMIGSSSARKVSRFIATNYLRWCLRRVGIRRPAVITTLPHISWLLGQVQQTQTIYYCTDDYSAWRGADQSALLAAEQALVNKASRVLAVSNHLMNRFSNGIPRHFFPHAVDFEHFQSASEGIPIHPEMEAISPRRVGFFGLIYEKLDFSLLGQLAREIAPHSLVMLGPVDYCPTEFQDLPNVHMVGKQPYTDLPAWIAGLDVLILPYLQDDEMIRQSSPLKLRECLATGKPTVSVDVPEVRKYCPHVRVAANAAEFVAAVQACLDHTESSETIAERQRSVETDTWDQRARELEAYLHT